jgi:hypothetical protein
MMQRAICEAEAPGLLADRPSPASNPLHRYAVPLPLRGRTRTRR